MSYNPANASAIAQAKAAADKAAADKAAAAPTFASKAAADNAAADAALNTANEARARDAAAFAHATVDADPSDGVLASAAHKPYTNVYPPDDAHDYDPALGDPGYKHVSELATKPATVDAYATANPIDPAFKVNPHDPAAYPADNAAADEEFPPYSAEPASAPYPTLKPL